ncbi:hypothetical protein Vau01_120830 [Virgisporangium aurantiacum]|uniref:Uncharacterized protein n=1 Tax=Virgisporangium aurantiacum TaxID=175570 RepID=A0A8J3ZKE0_9ACTN|nr:hypothetical protein Vau01_120830 [Virgisporangium aurantiacum]
MANAPVAHNPLTAAAIAVSGPPPEHCEREGQRVRGSQQLAPVRTAYEVPVTGAAHLDACLDARGGGAAARGARGQKPGCAADPWWGGGGTARSEATDAVGCASPSF